MFEAYALGALDAKERDALVAHLASGCKDCAKAVQEARWLVSQLAYMAPEAAPSDALRSRLMQIVRAEAQLTKPSSLARGFAIPLWMWAGVAALLALTVYSTWNSQQLGEKIKGANERAAALLEQRHSLEAELERTRRESVILADPASVRIILAPQDPQAPPIEAKWHAKLGIVLIGQRVPAPSGNRVLQLWLIPKAPGSKPIPSLALRPDTQGKYDLLVPNPPELMEQTKALAITEEPPGGSAAPTTPPRWVGAVSSISTWSSLCRTGEPAAFCAVLPPHHIAASLPQSSQSAAAPPSAGALPGQSPQTLRTPWWYAYAPPLARFQNGPQRPPPSTNEKHD
jgi:anti-sigma-K factor RskA